MKRQTIRNHKDFIVGADAFAVSCDCFVVKTKIVPEQTDSRYGIIASKRFLKLSTQRNRAKRLIRDWVAYNEDLMVPGIDYIFVANESVLNCDRETGRKAVKSAFQKIAQACAITKE